MKKIVIDNDILNYILEIEKNKEALNRIDVPLNLSNKFRKNTKKRSSFASNKIEGNPLSFEQASEVIDSKNRHYLKVEQEIRNYYLTLEFLESKLLNKEFITKKMILDVQKRICKGESKDKIGFRSQMPEGFLFAVRNDDRTPAYIPPEYKDVPDLINELLEYLNNSDDHPLIKAAILHYQLVTIHPFEDGNGRTARILSNYFLSLYGYGFKNIDSLEEYMSYDIDEYYNSIQMGLPVLYYEGRNNPPHLEIWVKYFLRIFSLYASKALLIAKKEVDNIDNERLEHLSKKAKVFLKYLLDNNIRKFAPVELSSIFNVSNRTIINWCSELANNGYIKPIMINIRIRYYELI